MAFLYSQFILIALYHLSFPLVLYSWMMNQRMKVLVASFKVPHHHFIVCAEKTNGNLHQDSWSPGKNPNLRLYRAWKYSTTKLPEVIGRTKTKIYCPATICRTCVLAVPVAIKVGLTKFGNRAKPVTYSEKSCYSYQFRADTLMYGHWPQNKADNNAEEFVVCTQMPGCCLNNMGNKILFGIKWQWANQVFHVAFLQGFSTAMFREKETLMLHLFTATNKTLHSIFGWAMCMWLSNWVLLVTPTAQCADLLGVYAENPTRISGENPLGTQEKYGNSTTGLQLISHVSPKNTSLPLTTIAGLYRTGPCCGLPGHQTSHNFTSSYRTTYKLVTYSLQLIMKRILLSHIFEAAATPKQKPGTFEHTINSALSSALYSGWWLHIIASSINW